jgi:ankyrin repeat protein
MAGMKMVKGLGWLLCFSSLLISGCVSYSTWSGVSASVDRDVPAMLAEIDQVNQDPSLDDKARNERLFWLLRLNAGWSLPLTRQLVEQGVPVNYPNNDPTFTDAYSPLHRAVSEKQLDIARYLLEQGADPNGAIGLESIFRSYPLSDAVADRNQPMVALLLEFGANPNVLSSGFSSALKYASYQDNNQSLVALLRSAGAVMKPSDQQAQAHLQADYLQKRAGFRIQNALKKDDWSELDSLLTAFPERRNDVDAQGNSLAAQALALGSMSCYAHLQEKYDFPPPSAEQLDAVLIRIIQSGNGVSLAPLLQQFKPSGDLLAAKAEAVTRQDEASLSTLLDYQPEVNKVPAGKPALLQLAVTQPSTQVTQRLLAHGADVQHSSPAEPSSPLVLAIRSRQFAQAELLLERGAKPDSQAVDQESATFLAISDGQDALALRLLKLETNLTAGRRDSLYSLSLQKALPDSAAWLASRGAKLMDVRDAKGDSLLANSISDQNMVMVEQLLAGGADPLQVTPSGSSMLHLAAKKGWVEGIQRLLALGVDPLVTDKYGDTPINDAVFHGYKASVITLLAAVPVIKGNEPWMQEALEDAVYKRYATILEVLLAAGGKPDFVNSDGDTLLYLASKADKNGVLASHLLAAGANVDLINENDDKETPLFAAALRGSMTTVGVLVSGGANINWTDADNKTALDRMLTSGASDRSIRQMLAMGAEARVYPEFLEPYERVEDDSNIWASAMFKAASQLQNSTNASIQQSHNQMMAVIQAEEQRRALERQSAGTAAESRQVTATAASVAKPEPKASASSPQLQLPVATTKPQTVTVQSGFESKQATASNSTKNEVAEKRALATHGEVHWGTLSRLDGEGKFTGTFGPASKQIGHCAIRDLNIRYKIGYLGHEPLVTGRLEWQPESGKKSSCIPGGLWAWLRLENGNASGYVWLSSGSPSWDRFVCGFDGGNRTTCFSAEQAKEFIRGARVTGYALSME